MNKVIINGFLGKKGIESKFTNNGTAVASYSIAIKDFKKQGTEQTYTYVNCVTWGKPAEFLSNNADKIKRLLVEGRISTRSYDAKDGTKKYITEIITENVEIEEWSERTVIAANVDYGNDVTPVESDNLIPF